MDALPTFGGGGHRLVVPLLAGILMLAEYLGARYRGTQVYDGRETLATLAIATGNIVVNGLIGALAFAPLVWAYSHRLADIQMRSAGALLALFVAVEFCYYWHHVAMHKMRWFWASHLVHHSARHFNLSAAIRLGWGSQLLGGVLFYLPLAWLGFPPRAIAGMLALGLLYQFLLHLAAAPRLGPLEWVFNTPTHHRAHHATNAACLDKNFGAVLIVFDRLFGTFAEVPRDEALIFGLKKATMATDNLLAILLMGWRDILGRLRAATDWRERLAALFGQP